MVEENQRSLFLGDEQAPLLLARGTSDQLCLPSINYFIIILLEKEEREIWFPETNINLEKRQKLNGKRTKRTSEKSRMNSSFSFSRVSSSRRRTLVNWSREQNLSDSKWTECAQKTEENYGRLNTWSVRFSATTSSKPASLSICIFIQKAYISGSEIQQIQIIVEGCSRKGYTWP